MPQRGPRYAVWLCCRFDRQWRRVDRVLRESARIRLRCEDPLGVLLRVSLDSGSQHQAARFSGRRQQSLKTPRTRPPCETGTGQALGELQDRRYQNFVNGKNTRAVSCGELAVQYFPEDPSVIRQPSSGTKRIKYTGFFKVEFQQGGPP